MNLKSRKILSLLLEIQCKLSEYFCHLHFPSREISFYGLYGLPARKAKCIKSYLKTSSSLCSRLLPIQCNGKFKSVSYVASCLHSMDHSAKTRQLSYLKLLTFLAAPILIYCDVPIHVSRFFVLNF